MPTHTLRKIQEISYNPNRPHYPWMWESGESYRTLNALILEEQIHLNDQQLREVLALPDDPYEKCETLMGVVLDLLHQERESFQNDDIYKIDPYLDRIRAAVLAEGANGQPVD